MPNWSSEAGGHHEHGLGLREARSRGYLKVTTSSGAEMKGDFRCEKDAIESFYFFFENFREFWQGWFWRPPKSHLSSRTPDQDPKLNVPISRSEVVATGWDPPIVIGERVCRRSALQLFR